MNSETLAELQKQYLDGIEKKLSELEEALKNNNTNILIEIFHKLAGSGKTYNMPEISKLGFEAEKKLKTEYNLEAAQKFTSQLKLIYLKYKK